MGDLNIVIIGLTVTSSWGNGHATTYRSLLRGLAALGHHVLFLERDAQWYASHRDLNGLPFAWVEIYRSLEELRDRFATAVRRADLVIVGSFVPEGPSVCRWVLDNAKGLVAFYDIDTPVTLAALAQQDFRYLHPSLIPEFDVYWSFTGGPMLRHLESAFGAARARPLYCAVDDQIYFPERQPQQWSLGYLGTYSPDRQPMLEKLLFEPASQRPRERFAVAGSMYPENLAWPPNVERIPHLAPGEHRAFYNSQGLTLNITRADMVRAGYSPSVRLFEAAACATPIVSDSWPGLEEFFEPGSEILVAATAEEMLRHLAAPAEEHRRMAARARQRVLASHTAVHRASELVSHFQEAYAGRRKFAGAGPAAGKMAFYP